MIAQDFARVRVLGAFSRGARGGTPRKKTAARGGTPPMEQIFTRSLPAGFSRVGPWQEFQSPIRGRGLRHATSVKTPSTVWASNRAKRTIGDTASGPKT